MTDDFSGAAAEFPDPFRLMIRDTAGSTNDELRGLTDGGAADGLVLLARHQTSGRGRRGSAWFAAPGDALTFSILVRPQAPRALWPRLALAAGLAVAEAVEESGVSAGIKWPNDVWIGQRKVAGILVEATADHVIVGIGLNVNTTSFPAELADSATSLCIASGRPVPRHEVLSAIIRHFAWRRMQLDRDFASLLDAVQQRCVLTGQLVTLTVAGAPRHGTVAGLAPGGELLLRTPNGLETLLQADEIRILKA